MPDDRKLYRIFVASPSDVGEERGIARRIIEQVGRDLGETLGCTLEARGWEDVRPGLGRAQALINPEVEKADLLIGILWKRFGTNTGEADSGTKEEFDLMRARWAKGEPVDVMFYVREPPEVMLADPGPQLAAVLEFRQEIERAGLHRTYVEPNELEEKLRSDLSAWLRERAAAGTPPQKRIRRQPRRSLSARASEAERRELLGRFLNAEVSAHRYLQMTGFETRVRMPIELRRVMVPVRTRLSEVARKPEQTELRGAVGDDDGVIDFDEAWRRAREKKISTLVVLGQPGAGKTTLLRSLLLRCAEDATTIGLLPESVPLLIPLRLVRPREDLVAEVERILRTEKLRLPKGFFEPALFEGRALLLLDGLDEVASSRERSAVARWIEEQRRLFPQCPIVVTARFAGYTGDARLEVPHLELSIERFGPGEIRAFLERWFVTVETSLGEDNDFYRLQASDRAADLSRRVLESPELFALATNPLMLQIIALVHRDRGALPERRVELYDECVNVLLEHWDRAKSGFELPLTAREARRVLQPVAYWMHQEPERRYAARRSLTPLIADALSRLPRSKMAADEFLTQVRDRSGLFVGYGTDEYGFQHLSFQEFLCACEVREREGYAELVRRYGESWWREATRLLVGLDSPSVFKQFMTALVQSSRFAGNHELTAACIRDSFEPLAEPFARALESSFARTGRVKDLELLQYHLLLALRELPRLALKLATPVIQRAARDGASPEARALAKELLEKLGLATPVERDEASGLEKVRVNEIDGTELLLVPAGAFHAGDDDMTDNRRREMELGAFYLARYPVTNAQYERYLEANPKATPPELWTNEQYNEPQQPVVGVSWHDAKGYCEWAGLRLPDEWEWEKAARGPKGHRYPWGDEKPDDTRANFDMKIGRPTPVGSHPRGASFHGHMDMAGNVWEWTESTYRERRENRTLRGGSFRHGAQCVRVAFRSDYHPDVRRSFVGFRCAQDA